ncbi:MAG: amidophosphoribosyltransferase [Candidatus Fluviicola riflensis]|nr:MAG: amidophosphoribosyltransferase [Candidatus Fluviicola riflensis]OGS78498.1 MAG: amidophosphoribosyltransferase [Candidatus Fluviicola riflensis]OGS85564.1 MAG: amidophosphoribosyltransferase [Fluviicola sp. RIFCSPHIGHO2_01_FULL_43_53]OGS87605.1 MAG: amidophosphoribosyltransferase [Fluviicola sp. RIFCSPHIGHO2_12_FULL_43_24]
MSDAIKHECGIALIRLKQPLQYYLDKYGTAFYGINKLHLLMEKQHNRGQDGAGVANIKLDMEPGERYISRYRSIDSKPIQDIFDYINSRFVQIGEEAPEKLKDVHYLKKNAGFTGELFLGHLRYGTFGRNSIESCHPFLRQNNWITRNLVVAGNFNLTNVDELFDVLLEIGQHPKEKSDTVTVLEKIGHFLDVENDELFDQFNKLGYNNQEIYKRIAERINVEQILKRASIDWDGGYAMAGLFGHGDAFVLRDPNGIRPAFWYEDDEVCVVASERPVIQTAFNLKREQIKELTPGHALIIKKNGSVSEVEINAPKAEKKCSFERIYFSRGNDYDIYEERKNLGRYVVPIVLKTIDYDLDNSVFSFIPNTAESSFYGMIKGLEDHLNERKFNDILALDHKPTREELEKIIYQRARIEKIAIKDAKLRTFITQDEARDDLVAHVYDITYGSVVRGKDNLVVIDDSIVRGTTLKQSILRILDRLEPKRIIVVSSAPQIRYPDCYGIDMAKMGDFIAFEATIALLKESGRGHIIDEVYKKSKAQENLPKEQIVNYVKEIYAPFTDAEVSAKIAQMLTPENIKAQVDIVYQSVENLHAACPGHLGDWYFTGDYPTPGGNKVVNKAFINFVEGKNERAY